MSTLRPIPAVAIAIAVTVVVALPVFLAGSLAVEYERDLGAGAAAVGAIVAAYWAVSALCSSAAGRLAERWGARSGIAAAASLALVAMTGVALLSPATPFLAGWVALAGAANALAHPPSNALIVAAVAHRRSTAMGAKQAAIPLATLVAGLAVPVVALTLGWRAAFAGGAVLALLVVVVALRTVPGLGVARRARRPTAPFPPALRRYLALMTVSGFLGVAQANMIGGFAVTTAVERGFEVGAAGALVAAASVVGIAMRLLVGVLADRGGGASMGLVAGMLALGALGLAGLALGDGVLLVAGLVLALGAGWSWNGLVHAIIAARTGERTASATGLVQTGAYAGGAAGPLLFGAIAELGGTAPAWGVGAALAAGAALTAAIAWRAEPGLNGAAPRARR